MARLKSPAREAVLAALSTIIALLAGIEWLGEKLRVVHVLTLVLLGMSAGMAAARAVSEAKARRRQRALGTPGVEVGSTPAKSSE